MSSFINEFREAQKKIKEEPQTYQVQIDGKKTTLLGLFLALQTPPFTMTSISVRHPESWSLFFSRDSPDSSDWIMDRLSSSAKYMPIYRTHRALHFRIEPDSPTLFEIWDEIRRWMPEIDVYISKAQVIQSKKRALGAKGVNAFVASKGGPNNISFYTQQFFQPVVQGNQVGIDNLRKINTTLFTANGGKRTRKGRKGKKTRRHRN